MTGQLLQATLPEAVVWRTPRAGLIPVSLYLAKFQGQIKRADLADLSAAREWCCELMSRRVRSTSEAVIQVLQNKAQMSRIIINTNISILTSPYFRLVNKCVIHATF